MPSSKQVEREKRRDPKQGRRWTHKDATPADWGSVDPTLVVGVVLAVTAEGGAVRFGYTSDGGAYAIGLYGDGDPHTEYVRPNEDIEAVLTELIHAWSGG